MRTPLPIVAGALAAALLSLAVGRRARDSRVIRGSGLAVAAGVLVLLGAAAVTVEPMFILMLIPLSPIGLAYWLLLVPAFAGGLLYALGRATALSLRRRTA